MNEIYNWAFLDENNIVVHITTVDVPTFTFGEDVNESYTQMVKITEERGNPIVGSLWNHETNIFE